MFSMVSYCRCVFALSLDTLCVSHFFLVYFWQLNNIVMVKFDTKVRSKMGMIKNEIGTNIEQKREAK